MKLGKIALHAIGGLLALIALAGVATAADRPYTEGSVLTVSAIRTEPGMFDSYMEYLASTYKPLMEAQKAAGVILDYNVYTSVPRSPNDPDIYLITVYKDMAALDGLRDKMEPVQQKLLGDQAQRNAAMIARGKMRTQLGSEMIRELKLK
jgi:hypothetical protein